MKRLHGVDILPPIHSSVIEAQILLSLNRLGWSFSEKKKFKNINLDSYFQQSPLQSLLRRYSVKKML